MARRPLGQKTFVIGHKPADANLVKLTGNFLIASVLESLGGAWPGVVCAAWGCACCRGLKESDAPVIRIIGNR